MEMGKKRVVVENVSKGVIVGVDGHGKNVIMRM
jgi:hypothetical protein